MPLFRFLQEVVELTVSQRARFALLDQLFEPAGATLVIVVRVVIMILAISSAGRPPVKTFFSESERSLGCTDLDSPAWRETHRMQSIACLVKQWFAPWTTVSRLLR